MTRVLLFLLAVVLLLPEAGQTQVRRPPRQPDRTTSQPARKDAARLRYERGMREAKNLIRRGKYEEALAHLDRIAASAQGDWDYLDLRGTCLRKLGRLEDASRLYRQGADSLLARGGDPSTLLIELERVLRERDDPEGAFAVCLEILRRGGGVGVWIWDEMEALIQSDRLGERALPLLREEIARRPEAEDLRDLYVGALFFLGRYDESLREAIALDRARGAGGSFLLERARMMDSKGVGEPALTTLGAAVAEGLQGEPLQEVHFLRARALRRLRRYEAAAAAYSEAAAASEAGPLAQVALRDRADLLVRDLGDLDQGAAAYERLIAALERSPRNERGRLLPQARVALADCWLRMGRYEEAGAILEQVEAGATDPESREEAAFQQAEIRFYAGEIEQARAGYDRVVEEYRGGKRVNDALDRILLLTRSTDAGALPLAALGQIAYQRRVGSAERALEIAVEAVRECGDCAAAEDLLREESLALLALGQLEEAAVRADTLAARFADGALAPALLRAVADRLRDRDGPTEDVLARYEQLVIRFPKSPEALDVRALLKELRSRPSNLRGSENGEVG